MEFIEVSAKTVDDAITKACIELQAASDKLEIQVISEGSSGFFGIGSKPAVIRAAVKAAPEKEPEAPQKPEKKEAAPAPVKEAPMPWDGIHRRISDSRGTLVSISA